ncbi:MAG: protein kinase [Verrucomicrobiaceae bacterium]|nr:protein kinase [Verrucomicrobiaceae bacterium]
MPIKRGIIHRDLKPSNIMVCDEAGKITPKVIDFGIAKVLEGRDASQADFTGVDQLVGTPGYISPEQIEHGSSHVDTRSDVYALGAILFELVCGKALITPADIAAKPIHVLLRDLAERDAPKPSTHAPDLAADIDWIVLKALERDPARRYSSANELAEDITRYLTWEPITARPPSKTYLISRFVRRHRVGVSASAAIAFAVIAGGITSTALYFQSEQNRSRAEQAGQDLRKSYSRGDEQMARQYAERGQFAPATAYLTRSLRTDPQNSLASTNLLSLLSNVHLMRPVTEQLPLPEGAQEAHLTALSRQQGKVIAVSTIMSGMLQAPLPPERLPLHEVISIWDIAKGAATRADHPLPEGIEVTCLQITADGKSAIIAKTDGSVELWSLNSDGQRRVLEPKMPSLVLSMALSADGSTLITGSEKIPTNGNKAACFVWDLTAPEKPARRFDHAQAVLFLDIDSTGTTAVAASNEGLAQVWDLTTMKPSGAPVEMDQSDGGISAVSLHTGSKIVAIGTNGGTVFVGNYEQDILAVDPLKHPGAVLSTRLTADGKTLYVSDASGHVHTWDLDSERPRDPPHGHDGEIKTTLIAEERGLVASVSKNGDIQVWDTRSGQRTTRNLHHSVSAASISPDASLLAYAPTLLPYVQVWSIYESMATRRFTDAGEKQLIERPPAPEKAPDFVRRSEAAAWNRPATHLIAADKEGHVAVFQGQECKPYGTPFTHAPAVGAAILSSDAALAITSGRDRMVRVWDVQTGRPIAAMQHDSFVEVLALSPDDQTLVTFTEKGDMLLWRVRTGEGLTPAVRHATGPVQARVSDDGKTVLFRLQNAGWFTMPMPAQNAVLPEWFLQFAEALAGNRLTEDGRMESLDLTAYQAATAAIPKTAARPEETAATRLAHWLLESPARRPLAPELDEPLPDYLDYLRAHSASKEATRELRRLQNPGGTP